MDPTALDEVLGDGRLLAAQGCGTQLRHKNCLCSYCNLNTREVDTGIVLELPGQPVKLNQGVS